ncbi:MAG: ABC transporter permease [Gaiellaceae bacterium]
MGRFLVDRLLRLVFVVFGATLVAFVLLRLAGDPASVLLPIFASPEQRQELRQDLNLDDPLPLQFVGYMGQVLQGDLGESWKYRQPATDIVFQRFPATLELVGLGIGFALVVGLVLGVVAATRAGGALDGALISFSLVARAVPTFWLGTLLILFFAVNLAWLPTSGKGGWKSFVMPVATIALFFVAELAMVVRAAMIEALSSDYVRAAVAKGLPRRLVVLRHALRNSLNPLVSVVAVNFGALLGGTVIVEAVFAWPGIGLLAVQSVTQTDYPVLQAIVLLIAVTVAIVTTVSDVLYGILDPRIRKGGA